MSTGEEGLDALKPSTTFLLIVMKKAKRKAANRRLKRLLSRYEKVRQEYLIPRYQRDTVIRQREILF